MENEKMMAVFSELLENQKEIARSHRDMIAVLRELKVQMDEVTGKMINQETEAKPLDIQPIRQAIETSMAQIRLSINTQLQKQSSNNWRVFLETDAKKWAVYLVVALTFLTYLYCFSIRFY